MLQGLEKILGEERLELEQSLPSARGRLPRLQIDQAGLQDQQNERHEPHRFPPFLTI